ncbi:hypothetical protein KI387_043430, partial [Taxus chinensis]
LLSPFSFEEVRKIVFSMKRDKVPGPDGFPASFYQDFWAIVGPSVWLAVEESRVSRNILGNLNHTFICLFPKKSPAEKLDDFRPISLCNTTYKIISKAIANRLSPLMHKLVAPEQSGFIPGRSITEGIIISHELIHSLHNSSRAGMLLKLDFSKAYDRVNWRFLLKSLQALGFGAHFCKWIFDCIASPRFSVLVNGSAEGFFQSSRGIRQGDPLSSFLFTIVAEALSRSIKAAILEGSLKGLHISSNLPPLSHQQFADDTFLFGQGTVPEARCISSILDSYSVAAGQVLNFHKSVIFFFNVAPRLQGRIKEILGFSLGKLPHTYLGIPLFHGKGKALLWNGLLNSISAKLLSWKGKWLSLAGRALLINSVLLSIPIYMLSILQIPNSVLLKIEKVARTFLWQGLSTERKFHLANWDLVKLPKKLGGLGILDMAIQNMALGAKLVWNFISDNSRLAFK